MDIYLMTVSYTHLKRRREGMKPELKVVLFEEKKILQELLRLLDDQHGAILALSLIHI